MAKQIYTFDERSMRLIAEMVKRELKRPQSQVTRNTQRPTAYKYTRLFEYEDVPTPSGDGEATLVRWNEEDEEWQASTGEDDTFTLTDFSEADQAVAMNMFGKWIVIHEPVAVVHFTATGTKAKDDDSIGATVVRAAAGPYSPSDTITVWDPDPDASTGFQTESGTFGRATRFRDGKLYIDWVKCVPT